MIIYLGTSESHSFYLIFQLLCVYFGETLFELNKKSPTCLRILSSCIYTSFLPLLYPPSHSVFLFFFSSRYSTSIASFFLDIHKHTQKHIFLRFTQHLPLFFLSPQSLSPRLIIIFLYLYTYSVKCHFTFSVSLSKIKNNVISPSDTFFLIFFF